MLPAVLLLVGFAARGGILPIPDQDIPSGKTLVVPIVASDPDGPPRSYSVTVGTPTTSGTPTAAAGIVATIRTGDPHLFIDVSYKPSVFGTGQFGAMEFQLLREFCPTTSQIIGGLAESGFFNPVPNGVPVSSYNFIDFFRVVPGFVIQGGDPNNNGSGGPGFAFENEFNSALIFSGTEGQLAMANAGTSPSGGTNGSQFFITLAPTRSLDYGYTIFGQLLRGYDTLNGIAGTPLEENESGTELSSPIFPVEINSVSISDNHTDAVLLLSATGVCDSVITVTATSPGSSAVASFTAHAVPDTTNDPPFLQPVPDSIARNGNLHLPLHGTDLQLDLLSYGYQSVLPLLADTATSGTSPLLALPLVSNTDNVFSATLEHYNPPEPYYEPDRRIFHLAAGDKSLAGSFTPIPFGFGRSLRLDKFPVAVFTAGNPKDTAADLTATVNWGDGTLLSGTDLGIVRETAFPTLNRFKVIASHDYQTSGEYPVIVDVSDRGGAHLTLTGTANVGSELIAIAARDIANIGGALRGEIVASVQDRGYAASASSDFSTFIDWGDGRRTKG